MSATTSDELRRGRRVALRHLRNADVPVLQRLAMAPGVRDSWRSRGRYWSPGELQQRVSVDPQLALVATTVEDDAVVGLAELHDLDPVDRRAQLGLLTAVATWTSPVAAEVAVLFTRFAFDTLPLDKVACTVQATNARAVRALDRLLLHEGTLRRHLNLHGTWVDLEVFALWRHELPAIERRLGLVAGPSADPVAAAVRRG